MSDRDKTNPFAPLDNKGWLDTAPAAEPLLTRADLDAAVALALEGALNPLLNLVEEFVTATWHLLDNSETSGPVDDPTITVWQPDFDNVCGLLDRCEGLPSGSTEHMTAGELLVANIRALIQPHQADALARMRQEAHNAAREVKPLVWDARADIPGLHNADSAIGWWYNVRELHHGGFEYEGDPVFAFRAVPQWFDTLEDAKAAAQADYTARVRAALAEYEVRG